MSTNNPNRSTSRFQIKTEADASGGWRLERAYQGIEQTIESTHHTPSVDSLAAATREERSERYQQKHALEVSS